MASTSAPVGRSVTLQKLLAAGILQPGENTMSIEYLVSFTPHLRSCFPHGSLSVSVCCRSLPSVCLPLQIFIRYLFSGKLINRSFYVSVSIAFYLHGQLIFCRAIISSIVLQTINLQFCRQNCTDLLYGLQSLGPMISNRLAFIKSFYLMSAYKFIAHL